MNSIKLEAVMLESGVGFGTSGARGLVESMTQEVCVAYASAFLKVVASSFEFKKVSIGIDLRPSSLNIATYCASAIHVAGYEVEFCGELPTPALALHGQTTGNPVIMVTGSHIPFDRNGLKFYRPDGEITKSDELAMLETQIHVSELDNSYILPSIDYHALDAYKNRYVDFFPSGMLNGTRLGLYEHSSVARDVIKTILEGLGAEVKSLGRTDVFVPIDTEAVSAEDVAQGSSWSTEYGFDAIISTDGDGDRPLIGDEHGQWLRGDIVGLITAHYLDIKALAVPISCNTAIEQSGFFEHISRTRIGSPYVIAGIQELQTVGIDAAGFEANGGFLLGSAITLLGKHLQALPTRDAVLPALAVLAAAKQADSTISTLTAALPKRYTFSDRIQQFPTQTSKALIAEWSANPALINSLLHEYTNGKIELGHIAKQDETDGLRLTYDSGLIVHLRPSGNAPELRCYCEADSAKVAEELTNIVLIGIAGLNS